MNDITSTITSEKIKISIGTHTSILNETTLNKINKDDIIKSLRSLKDKCKASNVTLRGYNKTLAFIKDNYSAYLSEYRHRQFLFDEVRVKAQNMLESSEDGVLDAEMQKECTTTRNEMLSLNWRSTLLSKFNGLSYKLEGYENKNLSDFTMIYIGQ